MISKVIDLLYLAKQNGIDILLVDGQLQLKLPKNKGIDKNLLQELKDNKALIIEFLKDSKRNNKQSTKVSKADKDSIENIPLSFSQERLWFIDQLEGSIPYHISSVMRFKGRLNKDALSKALKKIIERHEILRTVIKEEEGRGYQYVKDVSGWELQTIENSGYAYDPRALQEMVVKLISKPFDLSEDFMLRVNLIEISEHEHVLAFTLHHIAADGWSASIMTKELIELYSAFEENRESKLVPLQLQYSDFAIWQREYLQGEILEKKLNYWKKKLNGVKPLLLPTDFNRPPVQSFKGALTNFKLEKSLSDKLQELGRKNGTTIFMTLLAAFSALLYRYSDQEDICIGTPSAGRNQQELEGLIGFFINTLALRNEVKDEMSFLDLLKQTKTTTLEAYENQDLPFEKIVESVIKERDQSRSPLVQVMFVLQNIPEVPQVKLGNVMLSAEKHEHNTAMFDLTLNMFESPSGIHGSIQYSTDLYKEESVKRMTAHFIELLNSIVEAPDEKVGKLKIITKKEECRIINEFNGADVNYPADKTIVKLFEEQVSKTPDNVALTFEGKNLTYKELNENANQLAHYLIEKGLQLEDLVPICIERSFEMITGILAVLKAGGVYVPIDPEYPSERIGFIIQDTEGHFILTDKKSRANLPKASSLEIIEIDTERKKISNYEKTNPGINISPENLSYIIYTSGSTGRPKGVMIEHRNVARLFFNDSPLFNFTENDVWTMFHSFCFDFSVWEMYGALFYGGRLVIIPGDTAKDASQLLETILMENVTILNQTPSAFYVLQDFTINKIKKLPVRYVIFGGEALNPSRIRNWKNSFPECKLINMYGITETTVHVTYQEIGNAQIQSGISIIGRPIPTLKTYILDRNKNIVPVGIPGEMFVGGAGLARGYLNSADLTKVKFIPDIFSKNPDSRLYKTGDSGRWHEDGSLEYLRRIDEQVKIRGFRIELGEIESILLQSNLVKHAVILSREDKHENNRLIGYVVSDGKFNKNDVISYLKEKLPEYMVPLLWVEMENFPLTSNGKIDKKALPDPDASDLMRNEYEAPRNELERALAGIWEELLDIDRVGINDNFFELGGHSLLALRLFGKIEKLTGRKLAISTLFSSPTIKGLAEIIKDSGWTRPWKSLVAIKPGGSRIPIFIVPPASGTALHFQQLVKYIPEDQPVYVLESIGLDGKEQPHTDLREMAAFYVKEIQSLQPKGPYLLGGRCFGGRVVYEMAQQLNAAGHKIALLAVFDTWPPFAKPHTYYPPQKRDVKHFVSRSIHHIKQGELTKVTKNYFQNIAFKTKVAVKDKLEFMLSDSRKRLFDEVKMLHFKAQDAYIASQYPGKITLIECGAFKRETRDRWKNLAGGGLDSYFIPGTNHRTIMSEPHIKLFAEKLNFVLEKTNNEIKQKSEPKEAIITTGNVIESDEQENY